MQPFDSFFSTNGYILFDGGLATELEAKGAKLDDELWSASLLIDNPSLIYDTHLSYFRKGADIATTASYQASFEGFLRRGYDRAQAIDLFLLSIKLASQARDQFWEEHQLALEEERKQSDGEEPHASSDRLNCAISNEDEQTALGNRGCCRERQFHTRKSANTGVTLPDDKIRLRPLVAASIGCYGAALADGSEYRGDYGKRIGVEALKEWHRERMEVLAHADGVDLILVETVPCLDEIRAVLSLLQDQRPSVRAVISVSCTDEEHLRSGELVRDFARIVWRDAAEHDAGAAETDREASTKAEAPRPWPIVGIGINCTAPGHMAGALRILARSQQEEMVGKAPVALVAYPNSGEEWDAGGKSWVAGTGYQGDGGAQKFGDMAKEWYAAGARVLGGCCRTTPAHIAQMNTVLMEQQQQQGEETGDGSCRCATRDLATKTVT